jgi:hypothetical protein
VGELNCKIFKTIKIQREKISTLFITNSPNLFKMNKFEKCNLWKALQSKEKP